MALSREHEPRGEHFENVVLAVEVKAFLGEHRDRAVGGLVLRGGDETFWIAADVPATPWWQVLWTAQATLRNARLG